ncbi:MAG: hypothetical protein QMB24_12605 [Spirosomataceae bacterium]|jgi:hypothetical protein
MKTKSKKIDELLNASAKAFGDSIAKRRNWNRRTVTDMIPV